MVAFTKPWAVRDRLAAEIRAGALAHGDRLPGEHALAQRFDVSRSTVRLALASLQRGGYIATQAGSGSFVIYDGQEMVATSSWSGTLAAGGRSSTVRTLRFELVTDPALAADLDVDDDRFIALDRVRRVDAEWVSLEHSRLPYRDETSSILGAGIVGGSLTRTLARHGLVVDRVEEWASVARLEPDQARELGRAPGDAWLALLAVHTGADGAVIEHVRSWLDPTHFHLHHTTRRAPDGDGEG